MSFTEALGLVMLLGMVAVIFIGFPISFTLLFLALIFGGIGLGWEQTFNLAYLQIWGLMKDLATRKPVSLDLWSLFPPRRVAERSSLEEQLQQPPRITR